MGDQAVNDYSSGLSFAACNNVAASNHDIFRYNAHHYLPPKPERHRSPAPRDMLNGASNPQYLQLTESNPLFGQDRTMFGPYNAIGSMPSLSSMTADPLNHTSDRIHTPTDETEVQGPSGCGVKLETRFEDLIENDLSGDFRQPDFAENEVWTSADALDIWNQPSRQENADPL